MADKISNSKTVSMTMEFGDGSERTISQDEPIDNQSQLITQINELSDFIKADNLIISEKSGASFSRIKAAKIVQKTQSELDLER